MAYMNLIHFRYIPNSVYIKMIQWNSSLFINLFIKLFAVNSNKSKVVLALLHAGADINLADADGNTPLHHAALNGDFALCKLLSEHGADRRRPNAAGLRPAEMTSHTNISDMLE